MGTYAKSSFVSFHTILWYQAKLELNDKLNNYMLRINPLFCPRLYLNHFKSTYLLFGKDFATKVSDFVLKMAQNYAITFRKTMNWRISSINITLGDCPWVLPAPQLILQTNLQCELFKEWYLVKNPMREHYIYMQTYVRSSRVPHPRRFPRRDFKTGVLYSIIAEQKVELFRVC